ncbi:MAG: hypothetical protein JOZ13_03745 [Alphaproteobacteria bacterium]|nr:hypothetical protein [Alphaproteobacteria bacterium]
MAKDYLNYQVLMDAALRGVVRDVLKRTEKQGLVGQHHFFLTFKTGFPGVEIPDFLRTQYPDEMTVVLQKVFWGLKVEERHFEVTLSFQKLPATLVIPYEALTAFFDPGVQFGLQFQRSEGDAKSAPAGLPSAGSEAGAAKAENSADVSAAAGEVVSLDKFRKK